MALRSVARLAVVVLAAVSSWGALTQAPAPAGAVSATETPLPPGWELCIMQGLSAPATAANVADLDEWQAAEGGSTDNTAAFNPFNTRRTTNQSGAPLPETISSNGFPAFDNWLSGCAATVATLLQENMWAIDVALRAGGVMPPSSFLATVDQTQWCAPSNGQPCYLQQITGTSPSNGVPAVLTASSALQVYGNVNADLRAYQLSLVALASDRSAQASRSQALVAADAGVTTAQDAYDAKERQLGAFGVAEYVSGRMFEDSTFLGGSDASTESQQSAAAVQYTDVTASGLVTREHAAAEAVARARAQRDDIAGRLASANAAIVADQAAENRALVMLMADVEMLQTAGACTAVPAVATPVAETAAPASGGGTPATTTTTTAVPPPTTTTTTAGPATTTTAGPATTTTTSPAPSSSASVVGPPGAVTTTTSPPTSATSTTTTTGPTTTTVAGRTGSTTTTTTTPDDGTPPAETANPGGITSLQGCVATFTPTPST